MSHQDGVKRKVFKVCNLFSIMDSDSIQHTPTGGAHLQPPEIRTQTPDLLVMGFCMAENPFIQIVPKINYSQWFQNGARTLVSKIPKGWSPWSPAVLSVSSSIGAIPLCTNSMRDLTWIAGGWGTGEMAISAWTLACSRSFHSWVTCYLAAEHAHKPFSPLLFHP